MKKRMDRKGQFFLIGALVVVGLLLGFVVLKNAVKTTPEDVAIYNLAHNLNYESGKVIEQVIFVQPPNLASIPQNLKVLAEYYYNSTADKSTEIIISYNGTRAFRYSCENSGSAGPYTAQVKLCERQEEDSETDNNITLVRSGETITIHTASGNYEFVV